MMYNKENVQRLIEFIEQDIVQLESMKGYFNGGNALEKSNVLKIDFLIQSLKDKIIYHKRNV